MSRGVTFFAYNTPEIDYVKLASLCSRYVKRHMRHNDVCLITDAGSWAYYLEQNGQETADKIFNHVVITDDEHKSNNRVHYDSPWTKFTTNFKNTNKYKIFEYSPFDQTLMLDIDYIVQNDSLDYIFDSDQELAMFHSAEGLLCNPPAEPERRLRPTGIPMIWSTVIYFEKDSELTRLFFDIWTHVTDNYNYYKFLYGFGGSMYRTDFCVSIAKHIMNGMAPGDIIGDFPEKMVNMSQMDDIVAIKNLDEWIYIVNNTEENWKDVALRITNQNVHVMNKRSLDRHHDSIIKLFEEQE